MQKFLHSLKEQYPKTASLVEERKLLNPNLISPFKLELPIKLLTQIKKFAATVYEISESSSFQDDLELPDHWSQFPTTPSILNCFDFHYSEEMGLKLIEINTNASLYITSHILYQARDIDTPDPGLECLLRSFIDCFKLNPNDELTIFDKEPEKEGLYFEFHLYKEWLEKKKYRADIANLAVLDLAKQKKIYNRYTDFYLDRPESEKLKVSYLNGDVLFSPNPRGYALLADKRRLTHLKKSLDGELSSIIPESKLFSDFDSKDELWHKRKKYFLKPSQSFGSKAVFNGKGISRKAFDSIYSPDFLAQELCPAGRKEFEYDGEKTTMKFDLRFFTYKGEVQHYVARLYQGQATNMRTRWGGIAPIIFK